jgi:hypothetical protein
MTSPIVVGAVSVRGTLAGPEEGGRLRRGLYLAAIRARQARGKKKRMRGM